MAISDWMDTVEASNMVLQNIKDRFFYVEKVGKNELVEEFVRRNYLKNSKSMGDIPVKVLYLSTLKEKMA